ncbi:unnamed protein product [Pleuronectes platessa]|uniref:Uncharacterized protein n=1 Tax=Pleuronectes platessa TaxID=8262 RepID=A0A9N7UXB3_PLEPL|nr:unnamed protein product [Pleuronectes platessa]
MCRIQNHKNPSEPLTAPPPCGSTPMRLRTDTAGNQPKRQKQQQLHPVKFGLALYCERALSSQCRPPVVYALSEAVSLHINGPNGLTTGTKRPPSSLSPTLYFYAFHIFCPCCSRRFGHAVHKSLVIPLLALLALLRPPAVRFSRKLIFVQSDTLYVRASVSRTQFGHGEFSSQP